MDYIGIGVAHLTGSNLDVPRSRVVEGYLRVSLSETFQVTGDIQHLSGGWKMGIGQKGFVVSLRLTTMF